MVRLKVLLNSSEASSERLVDASGDLSQLLGQISSIFNIQAKRLFLANGREVLDVSKLQKGDVVYASAGEGFYKYSGATSSVIHVKLTMMGNGGVGKSSIALKFVRGQFVDRYDPTIEDSFQFQFPVDDHVIMFDILDTAGQEDMKCLRRQWMEGRDCYMLVFALNDRTSFDEALSLQDLVADVKDGAKKLPIVYVGNKSDLPKEQWQIQREEVESRIGGLPFLEASALSGENIKEVFTVFARMFIPSEETVQEKKTKRRCILL